jgi:Nucleotide modification associated domain 2
MVLPGMRDAFSGLNVSKNMKLYSYVMCRDYGFAPNPFGGYCTLATCKPEIRKMAQIGDWVIGTGSAVWKRQGYLIYAMKISDVLSFDEYWSDPRFQFKKPNLCASKKLAFGDNIYSTTKNGDWIQLDSHHSFENGVPNFANIKKDTKANRVLIAKNFAYFGGNGPEIPENLRNCHDDDICKKGPGHKCNFSDDMVREFIGWFSSLNASQQLGTPIDWGSKK